jgi:hypothetical protein
MALEVAPLAQPARRRAQAARHVHPRANAVTGSQRLWFDAAMRRALKIAISLIFPLTLGACGAREARPVAEQSQMDDLLSCAHLQGELAANQARSLQLKQEADRRGIDNLGMIALTGVAGLMFLDDGRAQQAEEQALQRRSERLRGLAAARGCTSP